MRHCHYSMYLNILFVRRPLYLMNNKNTLVCLVDEHLCIISETNVNVNGTQYNSCRKYLVYFFCI